ncbi:expansin-B3 [Cajanus cajan]|uniref:Expansin-B3 n=1 Tax=Cajanus cajan TaxID=3821 RepID=A0A151SFB9_CAJCA|nr:expansin-B3 [Cajanus cajan]KYP53401.1 Expansin-B3 [Cajanus cajan]
MQHHGPSAVFFLLSSCFSFALVYAQEHSARRSVLDQRWFPGHATWYGEPEGDGSNGGACGYGKLVNSKPMKGRVSAGAPVLFQKGKGCGACYKVKCLDHTICSKRAVTVTITDECPGCRTDKTHFDLSGAAFGRLALPGQHNQLRNRGELPISYRRTPCKYGGKTLGFHVNEGSSAYWLSLMVVYAGGDGDIASMHIQQAGSSEWMQMKHLWGAYWVIIKGPLKGPFSVKISTSTGKSLTAKNVIPSNWTPNATYNSHSKF